MNQNASLSVLTLPIIDVLTLDSALTITICVTATMTVRMERMKEIVEDRGLERGEHLFMKTRRMTALQETLLPTILSMKQ